MSINSTNICAHRGDSSRFRENTIIAIKSAIDSGAAVVEIDVRISKDGKVVVIHDPTLERLWGLDRNVSEVNWSEISELGAAENKIPLLSDVLPLFENSKSVLMIDMEESEPAKLAFEIASKSSAKIYWCGDLDGMRIIRSLSENANIWMPWNVNATVTAANIAELKPTFINSHYSFLTKSKVEAIHALGCKVSIWTVDDEATMRWAKTIGIDSVTTNELALLQRVLSEPPLISKNEKSAADIDLDRALIVARDLGKWAILVAKSMDPGKIELKENPADIVTEIDVMIEAHVREVISANFPGHNFVGEEMGGTYLAETPAWYLDPIDGTTNFANRMPWSSFSLALAFNRTPLLGIVIDPWRDELYEAVKGKGAKVNGKTLKVENLTGLENPLSSRIVSTELAAYQPWPGMLGLLEELAKNFCTMRIMGSGTLTLNGVAANRGVGAVIGHFSPIDHLAAVIIVHEAGGVVYDETGKVNLFPETGGIMTATPAAADALYKIWQKVIS
jgi:myo-inositol-1(or 4)-monophosphatase